jgi:REase_DpnII-MboI
MFRRIAGALSRASSGGSGPSRAQIQSALMIAGYDGPDLGNKAEYVQAAITESDDATAILVIEELVGLLRESGYFSFSTPEEVQVIARLRDVLEAQNSALSDDGYIDWALSERASALPIDVVPAATLERIGEMLGVAFPAVLDTIEPVLREESIPDLKLLVSSLRRLGSGGTRPIVQRRRGRSGIRIEDEYDLQDAVEVLLRCLFRDVRIEEPTPGSAGSSSRMDFLLKEVQLQLK